MCWNSVSRPSATSGDAILTGLRFGGNLVVSPVSEIDSAVGGSYLVAFRLDFNPTYSERLGWSCTYLNFDLNLGERVLLHSLPLSVGSKDDCSDVQGVNAIPLACFQVGKGMSRWVDGKHLKFREFLEEKRIGC